VSWKDHCGNVGVGVGEVVRGKVLVGESSPPLEEIVRLYLNFAAVLFFQAASSRCEVVAEEVRLDLLRSF